MAQVDSNIALSIKPAQIESPLVHAARAAELQGAQQTQFMNMLKMKEYGDESRTKNAMMKWLSDKPDLDDDTNLNTLATQFGTQGLALAKQIDERRKARGEADYRTAQITDLKSQGTKRDYELGESQTKNAINTISGFRNRQQAIDLLYESEANGTIPRAAAEAIRSTIPNNEEDFPAFKQELIDRLASPDERVRQSNRQQDRDAPKWELRKIGDREVPVDVNPYSKTVGQIKPGAEALVDDTPKWTARDLNGKIVYVDENRFSKTFGTQKTDMELTKTAAPAVLTESPLARLVREREALAGEAPNSPLLKAYDEAIDKETGGAPPELIKEYLYAQKNNGFKGTLLDFKKQVAMAGRSVSYTSSTPTLTRDALDLAADRFLTDGTLPSGISKPNRDAIMNLAAKIAKDKGISPDRVSQLETAANKQALGQLSKTETMVGSFEKLFVKNADLALLLGKKVDNTGVPLLQKYINAGYRASGSSPDLKALDTAIEAVASEYAKIVSGSMGNTAVAQGEKKRIRELINSQLTPQDLIAVINTMKIETKNRMEGFKEQRAELVGSMRSSTTAPAAKPNAPAPYTNKEKERRYQEWVKKQGGK